MQSRSETDAAAEAIVRSDDCRRLKAATRLANRGLLNHAYRGHDGGVAAVREERQSCRHGRHRSDLCGSLAVLLFEDLGEGAGEGVDLARCEAVA
jgi:hypothetical protein